MLLKPYNSLKSQLSDISDVKKIDWFNDQYSGIIHAAPVLFIEFPDEFKFETLRKKVQQSLLKVRIHTVSKVIENIDNSIDEVNIATHEAINDAVYSKLQGFRAVDVDKLIFNSLSRSAYQHHQYLKGWMVTTQDFEGVLYQHDSFDTIEKPDVEIETT